MNRKRLITIVALLVLLGLFAGNFSTTGAQGNGQAKGVLKASYREDGKGNRPDWVNKAVDKSLAHLAKKNAQFKLRGADMDDLGVAVRLDQTFDGVDVFGGQAITNLDNNGTVVFEAGDVYTINVNTKPSLNANQAEKAAKAASGYDFAKAKADEVSVSNRLVIVPDGSGVLTYQVTILIEDGTDATARHEYFINAQDGSVVMHYNNMHSVNANGTGKSLYSGNVTIGTDLVSGVYYLRDNTRGGMYTTDMRSRTSGNGTTFTDSDNIWGTNTTGSAQSAAVDAHYGSALTWDYFLNSFGRRGIDANGFTVLSRVHYGRKYNNAFWNGSNMTYGDGDGTTFTPLTSVDVAGHEITHGLTEKTAGLVYQKESGALNEAMSDIFGTMVEYSSAVGGDYLIGEDIYTPAKAGDALRNMANPRAEGDPDHYSIRNYPDPCSPSSTNDYCGVHSNSGIVNHAFYLLAEGGTNRVSGLSVTGIGRSQAAAIFYRALTMKMGPNTTFSQARAATLSAASDLYGAGSTQYNAVAQAWTAVGVQ